MPQPSRKRESILKHYSEACAQVTPIILWWQIRLLGMCPQLHYLQLFWAIYVLGQDLLHAWRHGGAYLRLPIAANVLFCYCARFSSCPNLHIAAKTSFVGWRLLRLWLKWLQQNERQLVFFFFLSCHAPVCRRRHRARVYKHERRLRWWITSPQIYIP